MLPAAAGQLDEQTGREIDPLDELIRREGRLHTDKRRAGRGWTALQVRKRTVKPIKWWK